MIITDAHQHFWTAEAYRRQVSSPELHGIMVADYQPAQLKEALDQSGVQETVLVQAFPTAEDTRDCLRIASEYEWIAAVVGWVDLADPQVGDDLDRLMKDPKFKGVRHPWEGEPDPAWITRTDVIHGLRETAERGISFDLLVNPRQWEYIPRLAEAVPDLWMVIDHIGKPRMREREFDNWAAAMAEAAKCPRIACKLSGMASEVGRPDWSAADLKPYVEEAIRIFGPERLMIGSDWPPCLFAGSYADIYRAMMECIADLSSGDQALLLGENARRFYRID